MWSQHRGRSALASILATLVLALLAQVPGAGAGQATPLPKKAAIFAGASPICDVAPEFSASNFPSMPKVDGTYYPLIPGTQFVLEGVANDGSGLVDHQVIFTVTDLTKVVDGVKTVVLWDRDFSQGVLTEAELAFHAQDTFGNPWNLGEYPAQYKNGKFIDAPDTWFAGLSSKAGVAKALGGWVLPGNPQVSTQKFIQAYEPGIIGDCGWVDKVGQHVCNQVNCYDNVVIINEESPGEPGTQQKYYAPGVGNFQIGALNDPQGETLVLTKLIHLGRADCIAARDAALALEDQAYNHDTSQKVYDLTAPVEQTGLCEAATPTVTPTATPLTTPTPGGAPDTSIYLPLASNLKPTSALPPALYDGCQSDPNPASAPNTPVRIVSVNKLTEVVTLQNVGDRTISLEDWNLCSLNGNQDHDQIFGTIAPGQMRTFPNIGTPNIWNDTERDDAALYNAAGVMVSYWADQ
jgi:hypothetical protein